MLIKLNDLRLRWTSLCLWERLGKPIDGKDSGNQTTSSVSMWEITSSLTPTWPTISGFCPMTTTLISCHPMSHAMHAYHIIGLGWISACPLRMMILVSWLCLSKTPSFKHENRAKTENSWNPFRAKAPPQSFKMAWGHLTKAHSWDPHHPQSQYISQTYDIIWSLMFHAKVTALISDNKTS